VSCEFAELNELITFQSYTEVSDGMGGVTKTAVNISTDPTAWAKVTVLTGAESQTAERRSANVRYRFKIHNRNDITEGMIISWNSRTFNITAVLFRGEMDQYLYIETDLGTAV